jgi:hypothetical protein
VGVFCLKNDKSEAYFALNFEDEELIKEYIFEVSKSKSLVDINALNKKDKIIIVGTQCTNFFDEKIYSNEWNEFNNLFEAQAFFESLNKNYPIYVFLSKDDIKDKIIQEYEQIFKANEEKRMRVHHFDGDVIITDPCYIISNIVNNGKPSVYDYFSYNSEEDYPDYDKEKKSSIKYNEEWVKNHPYWDYDNLEPLGFSNYLTHNTMVGDWYCIVSNIDTNEKIGDFCADSGNVGVFLLSEVLSHNKDFDLYAKRPDTTTLIKDFHGDIWFEKLDEQTLIVKGNGNINFQTMMIGF